MTKLHTRKSIVVWALLLVLAAASVLWVNRPAWSVRNLKYVKADSGILKHEVKVEAVFANEEHVLHAPVGGAVEFLGSEGERFRRGEVVARTKPLAASPGGSAGTATVQAPSGGLLYPYVDGLENIWTPENFKIMDLTKLLAMPENRQNYSSFQPGQPLGKIVNNLVPSVAFVKMPALEGLTVGKNMRLLVGGKVQTAKILRKSEHPLGVVVEFAYYVDGSTANRRQEITWISRPETKGIIVPKSALWTRGEEIGVYAAVEGILHFRKVTVVDENEAQACVADLPAGLTVVENPREGLEGLPAP